MIMKKKLAWILGLILIIGIAFVCVFRANYVLMNGEIFDRDATDIVLSSGKLPDVKKLQKIDELERLDLRGTDVSIEFYDMLCKQLPGCEIYWNVPFQADYIDNSVSEITVRAMTPEYEAMLKYFPNLQTVDARESRDYAALLELAENRPDLQVMYCVDLGNVQLRENATDCTVTNENVGLLLDSLEYLQSLQTVNADRCTDYETLLTIHEARPELNLIYSVVIGQVPQPADAAALTLDIADAEETLELLQYFSQSYGSNF